jgi:hypothetical protein
MLDQRQIRVVSLQDVIRFFERSGPGIKLYFPVQSAPGWTGNTILANASVGRGALVELSFGIDIVQRYQRPFRISYALRPGPRRPILAATSGSESAGAQGPPRLPRLEVVAHGVLHFSVEETVKQGHGESLGREEHGPDTLEDDF